MLVARVTPHIARREALAVYAELPVRSFETLGGAFLKAAQALSARPDLLDDQTRSALARLCDSVEPLQEACLDRLIRGLEIGDLDAESVSRQPIGSGSAAQVHTARCAGETVAIKFLRPGVRREFNADMLLARALCHVITRTGLLPSIPLMSGLDTLQSALRGHIDLQREAANHRRFVENFAGRKTLRIPHLVPELCSSDAVVMEYIADATRIDSPTVPLDLRADALRMALRGLYQMIFLDGMVHCDYHPGNLLVTPHGDVVLVDFGYVAEIAHADRRAFARLFLAMVLGDVDEVVDVVVGTSVGSHGAIDSECLRADLAPLVEEASGMSAAEFSIAGFVGGLFAVLRKHNMVGNPGFMTSIASLLAVEGMLKEFSPDIDFQREAVPYVTAAIASPTP